MGRSDDLLNIGGTKMPPSVIEEMILRTVNAKDAGVCSIRNQHGIEELLIAVADAPIGDRELQDRIAASMSHEHPVPLYRMLHKRFVREIL